MFSVRVRRPNGEYASLSPPSAQHAPDLTIESLTEFAAFLTEALELLSANSDLTNCKPVVQKRLGGFNVDNT